MDWLRSSWKSNVSQQIEIIVVNGRFRCQTFGASDGANVETETMLQRSSVFYDHLCRIHLFIITHFVEHERRVSLDGENANRLDFNCIDQPIRLRWFYYVTVRLFISFCYVRLVTQHRPMAKQNDRGKLEAFFNGGFNWIRLKHFTRRQLHFTFCNSNLIDFINCQFHLNKSSARNPPNPFSCGILDWIK